MIEYQKSKYSFKKNQHIFLDGNTVYCQNHFNNSHGKALFTSKIVLEVPVLGNAPKTTLPYKKLKGEKRGY